LQDDSSSSEHGKELDTTSRVDDIEITIDANRLPLDRYAPLAELGRGAAGTVYLCRDRLLGAKVAVKCLNYLNAQQLLSFQQEAKATFKLTHPNIVKVINFDVTETGSPYMVMEYFPSVSLADLISERGGLKWNELSGIFLQIVEGLTYAHKNEIFHRDIKPTNILLQQSGNAPRLRIIDFGVALVKDIEEGPEINQGETLVGTPEYMSPDQATGIAYDARSEIYSLGCLAFAAATGRPPFKGKTPLELINQHAHSQPPLISDLAGTEYPSEFVSLVDKMLQKNPEDRPQSMEDVKTIFADIEHLADPPQTASSPTVDVEIVQSDSGRRKFTPPAIVVSAVIATVALLLASGYWITQTEHSEEKNTKSSVMQASSVDDPSQAFNKFKMDRVDFDGLNNTRFVLTRKGEAIINDDDLRYVERVNDPESVGINLASFKGVKGKGIKYLVDSKIKCVTVQGAALDPIGYENLAKIKALEELQLDSSNVTDRDLEHFRHHPNIRYIVLGNCKGISDRALNAVATMPNLSMLDLSNTEITDEGLKNLRDCTKLNRIILEGTKISDQGLKYLSSWPAVLTINIAQSRVSGDGLRFIVGKWPGLELLELGGSTKIKPEDLECLRNSQVKNLDIIGLPISNKEMQTIGTLKSLNSLHITKGTFSKDALKSLYPLTNLWSISILGTRNIPKEDVEQLKKRMQPMCGVIIPTEESQVLPEPLSEMYSAASQADKPLE
jgi:Serine/threonine protein kinase